MPKLTRSSSIPGRLPDTGSVDCRSCITSGNEVGLWIKAPHGISYMWVSNNEHVVYRYEIPDPDSSQALFDWINKSTPDGFGFVLQNKWINARVVGIENFTDGEPLTLQLEGNNKDHYYMYKHGSDHYFSLHLKSPDGHFYYVLPMNGTLRIYREDTIKKQYQDNDLYVFTIGSYKKCSNAEGPCPFERMMRTR